LLELAIAVTSTSGVVAVTAPNIAYADDDEIPDGASVIKTDSGLRYVDLEEGGTKGGYGSDETPRYGQLCTISFTAYMKLPNSKEKQKFAATTDFVIKHGNGKMIPGLDEGIHTMKRGGLRRLIIPPKLGFIASGLGPIPEMPWQRWRLNSLLENMIAQRGGNLIYDVRLERFFDDEADQGYYEDMDITPEERAELEFRLLKGRNGGGRGAEEDSALDAVGDDVQILDRGRQKPIV
jgi:hypothetical protein